MRPKMSTLDGAPSRREDSGCVPRRTDGLLGPDEHPVAVWRQVVDDQGGAVAFEVINGEPQVLEIHAVAVEVDGRAPRLHAQQPERQAESDDAAVRGIEREEVE